MTTRLELETDDFVDASRTMYSDVADPVCISTGGLVDVLLGSAAMAGSDPGGLSWASSYDEAAITAVLATRDVINACYRLSSMFAQTARNYEAADSASTAGVRHAIAAATATVPFDTMFGTVASLPSAGGGSGGTPNGWSIVSHLVGYIWPNGHQDRLRSVAAAWNASADALQDRSDFAEIAAITFMVDRLPEVDDMLTVCRAMATHLRELASVHRSLGRACADLAHHIDEAHSQAEGELRSLVDWTAGIEGTGALLAVVSFGGTEVAAQAAEAGRIAKTAASVAAIIERFTALARAVATSIATVAERADKIAAELHGLLDVRLTVAIAQRVRTLPGVLKIREVAAMNHLTAAARGLVPLSASTAQLDRKFKHAADFGVLLAKNGAGCKKFEQAMQEFIEDGTTVRLSATKARYDRAPAILSYNPRSRLVVIQHPDGTFWSCWRMSNRQLVFVRKYGMIGRG